MATVEVAKKFRAIVAAARRMSLDSNAAAKATVAARESWQEDIWPYYDEVPEAKYALNFVANSISKVTFYAAARDESGAVVPINAEASLLRNTAIAAQADFEMARVKSPVAGQAEINRLLTLNVEITGECHLHGMPVADAVGEPDEPGYIPAREIEQWDVRSKSEVEVTAEKVHVILKDGTEFDRPKILIKKSPDDEGTVFDADNDTLIRYWQRHPRWTERADSFFRGCMSDCEMITLYSNEAKAVSKSRHNAGAFTLPSELSFVDDTNKGESQDDSGDQNAFIRAFADTMVDPIKDPASPSAVQPLLISGPAEFLRPDVLRKIDLSRPADDKIHEKLDKHINRLARGLNVPVEVVMGHMSTTFANAEQIDQDVYDDHLESRVLNLAEFYLVGFLRPQLLAAGFDADMVAEVEVGADVSRLVRQKSPDENAAELFDNNAISFVAYRRMKNVSEDDAPDEEEFWRNVAIRKGIFTADLTTAILTLGGVDLGVSVTESGVITDDPAAAPSDDVEEEEEPQAIAAAARPQNPGKRLAAIDRSLRERVVAASDAALSRALERAGNKLKNKGSTLRTTLRSIPPYRCAAHVGPALIAEGGLTPDDLLDGAWDELAVQFKTWATDSGAAALDVVSDVIGGMSKAEREALKLRQLADVDEAWQWLDGALSDEGKHALFNPDNVLDELGEIDFPGRVPPGLIREALARAGGASGFSSKGGVLTPTNKSPLGGVATGELVMGKLADEGVGVEGYTWVYGPARRRGFEPHAQLNGQFFENFDDAVLSNNYGWPDISHFYPGDHNGCVCDFEPSIGTAASTKAGEPEVEDDLDTLVSNANEALAEYHEKLYGKDYTDAEIDTAKAKFDIAGGKMKAAREAKMDKAPVRAAEPVAVAQRQIDDASRAGYDDLVGRQGTLDRDVRDALQVYEGEGYRNMNAGGTQYRDEMATIKGAMEPLGERTVLYRGMTGIEDLQPGTVLSSKGFVSTTLDPNLGASFSRSSGGVLGMGTVDDIPTVMRITTSASRKALAIPKSPELEVLLAPGTKLKIVGTSQINTPTGLVNIVEVTA